MDSGSISHVNTKKMKFSTWGAWEASGGSLGGSNGGSLKGILRGNPPGLDQSPETLKKECLIRLDLGNTRKHNICLDRPPGGTRTATRRPKMPQGSQESPRRAHDPRTSSRRHQDVPDPRSLKVLIPRLPKPTLKSTRGHPRGIGGAVV